MGYRLTNRAEEDIISLFVTGSKQFGTAQAEHYHNQLERCFQFLADNPLAAPQRNEISPPVRVHPFGAHLIIYQTLDTRDILVIRIRHAHEDWINDRDEP